MFEKWVAGLVLLTVAVALLWPVLPANRQTQWRSRMRQLGHASEQFLKALFTRTRSAWRNAGARRADTGSDQAASRAINKARRSAAKPEAAAAWRREGNVIHPTAFKGPPRGQGRGAVPRPGNDRNPDPDPNPDHHRDRKFDH